MYYKIKEETLNNLLKYLVSKPYAEVFQGIEELKNLEQIKEDDGK